jgi:hypothetical protein
MKIYLSFRSLLLMYFTRVSICHPGSIRAASPELVPYIRKQLVWYGPVTSRITLKSSREEQPVRKMQMKIRCSRVLFMPETFISCSYYSGKLSLTFSCFMLLF